MPAWHEAFIVWLSAGKPTPDIKKMAGGPSLKHLFVYFISKLCTCLELNNLLCGNLYLDAG